MSKDEKELFRRAEGKLYSYNRTKAEVEYLNLEIEEIKNDYRGYGAIAYDEISCKTYNISNTLENEVINKEKSISLKTRERNKKDIAIKKINNALTILDEDEMKLIEKRYFNNKTISWETIAKLMNLSVAKCYQMRAEIIDKIKDLI